MIHDTVLCGDCQELLTKIPDKSIDLIVTDPPYEISGEGEGGTVNNLGKFNQSLKNGIVKNGIINGFNYDPIFKEFDRVLKNINLYVFCNKVQIPIYFKHYVFDLNCKFDILLWHKTNALPTYFNKYLTDCEYLLYFRKNANCHPKNYEDAKTIFSSPLNVIDKNKYGHPTIKPLELIRKIIRNSSNENDLILDPFGGSGTTAIACLHENRRYYVIEKQEQYYDIIKKRINEFGSENDEFFI